MTPKLLGLAILMALLACASAQTTITDCTGLQNMNLDLAGNYALANNIDCSDTVNWNSGTGFEPVGTNSIPFAGNLTGNGHTINSLFINRPSNSYIGLFGYLAVGVNINDLTLNNTDITGYEYVGGLAGSSNAMLTGIHVTGSVTNRRYYVGGLVAYNGHTIHNCSSAATVSGLNYYYAGGLIGSTDTDTTVTDSYATGAVSGGRRIGGLIGNQGSSAVVKNCHATGTVTASGMEAGGLVGRSFRGKILNSYATGHVSSASSTVGGLVGVQDGSSGIIPSIENCHATGDVSSPLNDYVGGLVGRNTPGNGLIDRSYALGDVVSGDASGGLVGTNNGVVTHCYSRNTLTAQTPLARSQLGGLIGQNTGSIIDSYAMTTILSSATEVGGLVGENTGTITNVYSMGVASGLLNVGGLIGWNTGTVTNAFWDTDTSNQQTSAAGTGLPRTTLWQKATYTGWNFTGIWSINENNNYPLLDGIAGQIITPSLPYPSEQTIGISSCLALQTINDNLHADYLLQNDIDCSMTSGWNSGEGFAPLGSSTTPFTGNFSGNGYSINGLHIHRPSTDYIGLFTLISAGTHLQGFALHATNITGYRYVGGLVGLNAAKLKGITVSGAVTGNHDYVGGLVGRHYHSIEHCSSAATITGHERYTGGLVGFSQPDASVTHSHTTGSVSGRSSVGGLIGSEHTDSLVSHCYAEGNVMGASSVGGLIGSSSGASILNSYATGNVLADASSAGGLLGSHSGGTATGTVQNCYASGNVSSGGDRAGGLVGQNGSGGTVIRQSYALGAVSSAGSSLGGLAGINAGLIEQCYAANTLHQLSPLTENKIGGLVGRNAGTLTNVYAMTHVISSSDEVGGLVGENENPGTITNAYSMGVVSGLLNVGGLIGLNTGTVTNAFWDTDTSNQQISAAGTGLPRTALWQQATYTGWNFAGIWSINENNNYPLLDGIAGQIISPSLPYPSEAVIAISSCSELQGVNNNLHADYVLQNDIDCSMTSTWNSGAGFEPLGALMTPFSGDFSGNGYAINELYITAPSTDYVGLFTFLSVGANVHDLTINAANITGNQYPGTLAGLNAGMLDGVALSGALTAQGDYAGGLVAHNYGRVQNCSSTSTVTGNDYTGGLIGLTEPDTVVLTSYTQASVSGILTTGGLIGKQDRYARVEHCYAEGSVIGTEKVGGLIGESEGGIILDSYSTSSVTATRFVGGLVGSQSVSYAFINRCFARGDVSSISTYAGGLVGYQSGGVIQNAFASGDVSGSTYVGGAIGSKSGTVSMIYSTGLVTKTGSVAGGLIGQLSGGTLEKSYWDITASGQASSAAGTGRTTTQMKQEATYVDWDFTSTWTIIENVTYPQLAALWELPTTSQSKSASASPSISQSHSLSRSHSNSFSTSRSHSVSESESVSQSNSASRSHSASPTPSQSPTPSNSMSHSGSLSLSQTQTHSASSSQSSSPAPTQSPSASPTLSQTGTPSPSKSQSRSPAPTQSPSASPIPSQTEAPAATSPTPPPKTNGSAGSNTMAIALGITGGIAAIGALAGAVLWYKKNPHRRTRNDREIELTTH